MEESSLPGFQVSSVICSVAPLALILDYYVPRVNFGYLYFDNFLLFHISEA
jgi:hypothetical protein